MYNQLSWKLVHISRMAYKWCNSRVITMTIKSYKSKCCGWLHGCEFHWNRTYSGRGGILAALSKINILNLCSPTPLLKSLGAVVELSLSIALIKQVTGSPFISNTALTQGGGTNLYSNDRHANVTLASSTFNYYSITACSILDVDNRSIT